MGKTKLTAKQDKFVKAYLLNGGNATQAAIDAGYKADNAAVIGCENLIKPNIKAEIEKHQEVANEKFSISVEWRLKALQNIHDAGVTQYMDGNEKLRYENLAASNSAIKTMNEMLGTTEGDEEDKGKPIPIHFEIAQPISEVKITIGEGGK